MNAANETGNKPEDWILLGTLVHAVLKAADRIQHAESTQAAGDIAGAINDFARDVGSISGVASTEKDGVTSVTRDGRTAIVGSSDTFGTGNTDFGQDQGDTDPGDSRPAAFGFGGKLNDPLTLGRQLGAFLSQMMNVSSSLESIGDRIAWVDSLMVGLGSGLRGELPVPVVSAVFCRTTAQLLATHLLAAQSSGRTDFGLRVIRIEDLGGDLNLSDFCTDKTPPEMRKVFDWLAQVPDVVEAVEGLITPEDVEALGYSRTDVTRH